VSLQAVASPASTSPASALDWLAIVGFSLAFWLTGAGLLVLRDSVEPGLNVNVTIVLVAIACVVAGITNLLENGFGASAVAAVFAVSALVVWLGLFAIGAMIAISRDRSLAFVPLLTAIGFALFEIGGGVLTMAAWVAFARIVVRRAHRVTTTPPEASPSV